MNMPAYTAECSLYKATRSYVTAPHHAAVGEGEVVPAQQPRGKIIIFQPDVECETRYYACTVCNNLGCFSALCEKIVCSVPQPVFV
jgi:hypothetical protein